MEKKWAQKVDIKEGALKAMGWPDGSKIAAAVSSGKVPYATAIRRLQYLVNINSPEAAKAKGIIVVLQRKFRKEAK